MNEKGLTAPFFIYMDVLVTYCSCVSDTSAIHGGRMPVMQDVYMDNVPFPY
ncbi:MAG: hypothetical protein HN764_08180 [Gammaproteobacteria bacterium]|nr:hypothetical protein [Gammaproteobacteria bacterium]